MNELFKQTENLIYQRAWYYSRKYKCIPFAEIRSQAYFIFCEATQRYNPGMGASFVTFLYHRLRTLNDYCQSELRHRRKLREEFDTFVGARDTDFISRTILEQNISRLSSTAQQLVRGILTGEFHIGRKMTYKQPVSKDTACNITMQKWGWPRRKFTEAWMELKQWYSRYVAA